MSIATEPVRTATRTIADGNEAVAGVAYALSEVIAIYPITPSSGMAELSDQWSAERRPNLWGTVPAVVEMQSEAGAAGALHGAVQTGALSTTFTASQGLLLMIPNMFKMAGELSPVVFHVSARSVATQALSIFGDHSDVMAVRSTGFALLASGSVQEASDLAAVAHAAALSSRIPFLHFFDGFRTSHELSELSPLSHDDLRAMVDEDAVAALRARGLSPERPVVRGTAHNPDTFFQARETCNPFYAALPHIVQEKMDALAARTGRQYRLYDYLGAPDAERVVVVMGSGAETVESVARHLQGAGEKVGVLKVRLYRPFSIEDFAAALPATTRAVAVLDRTKEPGSAGEPLYQDVVTALAEAGRVVRVVGGRYGLSSKEFTPAMALAVFNNLSNAVPRNHFTVGIIDDVSHTHLDYDDSFTTESPDTVRAVFYGLGSDGTVGANKNSIKIIGTQTDLHAQGYFVYDSKKSGSMTVSHLRFGPSAIHAPYLIRQASFVACHQFSFLARLDVLSVAAPESTFLLNSPHDPDTVWDRLPREVQQQIIDKRLRFYVIDALKVARGSGMGTRINTVMQTCFFALSQVLPRELAIEAIKHAIEKTYAKRGEAVVRKNFAAVDAALAHLHRVEVPATATGQQRMVQLIPQDAPPFIREVTARLLAGHGDQVPVSALPVDGTWPVGTTRWEKRNISADIPIWDKDLCIQCGKCVLVCPHAVLRANVYDPARLTDAPAGFKSAPARWKEHPGEVYTLQVAPEDCTGCTLCVDVCPVRDKTQTGRKAINMAAQASHLETERHNWDFFRSLPETPRTTVNHDLVKDVQLLEPLFEFSGACTGCGETPYVRLVSQLFGDHSIIANATGCSSIYGGNLPTTPWTANAAGLGPAWSNSLFEDNAEFGLGFRVTLDKQQERALDLVRQVVDQPLQSELVAGASARDEAGIAAQRARVKALRERLAGEPGAAADLLSIADRLVYTSVWIMGGDGWAYDIGYGGLDHVLASGRNVNVLVLDTEVYSNTGGQMSKSTPKGAVAKFAAGGKAQGKKDLALLALAYENVYVARIAMGANDTHTLRVLEEAEAYDGPSLVIAYSHCIAHGYDMARGLQQQKAAVASGHWPLFHYHPGNGHTIVLDSKPPSVPLEAYVGNETRYTMLRHTDPETADRLMAEAQSDVGRRWALYEQLAGMKKEAT